jgi:hypothetical protein
MKLSRRIGLLLVLLASIGITCFSQTPAKEATASVAGRVTIGGKAAPNITVVASFSASFFDTRTVAKTVTDEDGNYKLIGLMAGKFQIFPLAQAYVCRCLRS